MSLNASPESDSQIIHSDVSVQSAANHQPITFCVPHGHYYLITESVVCEHHVSFILCPQRIIIVIIIILYSWFEPLNEGNLHGAANTDV